MVLQTKTQFGLQQKKKQDTNALDKKVAFIEDSIIQKMTKLGVFKIWSL